MFTREALAFLVENRARDDREWYQENKERHQRLVVEPFKELVARLGPVMRGIDEALITEPRVDRTISRVYRDTRFSKDKRLYRDNAWLVFARDRKLSMGPPGFFFEISPAGYAYGMGYYQAAPASMAHLRAMILEGHPLAREAVRAYEAQSVFTIEGEAYKRTRHPDQPENLRQWLDMKSFSFVRSGADMEAVFSDGLADMLAEGFLLLEAEYKFIIAAE